MGWLPRQAGSLLPTPNTGTAKCEKGCCAGLPAPKKPVGSSVTIKCKYLWRANFPVLLLLAKGLGTHLVLAQVLSCWTAMLTSPGESCLGKDRTHKRGGGWETGKTGDSKITRTCAVCLAEFGWCCGVGTRAKMGNTVLEMTKRLTEEASKNYKGEMKGGRLVNVHAVDWQITLRLEKLIC